jgi:uncharacterized MnhB-related membrane protein
MLLFIAGLVIASPGLFRSILLFFVFGLLMSLAWVRLNAVDVALAEAAIGAGLTGAIFLAAYSRVQRLAARQGDRPAPGDRAQPARRPAEPKGD